MRIHFILRNNTYDEIWICFPNLDSAGPCNEALIWNYRENTWTRRDLPNSYSGTQGPINGGGGASVQKLTVTGSTKTGKFVANDPFYDGVREVTEVSGSGNQSGSDTAAVAEITRVGFTAGTKAGSDALVGAYAEEVDVSWDGVNSGGSLVFTSRTSNVTGPPVRSVVYNKQFVRCCWYWWCDNNLL